MATGDVTISIAVEGGETKSIILDSDTRALSRTSVLKEFQAERDDEYDTDAKWQVFMVNKFGTIMLTQANAEAQATASWTRKTFTEAT